MNARTIDPPDRLGEQGILFVTRKWEPATGGMETYSIKLAEALAEHASIEVIALRGRADGMPPGPLALLAFPLTVLARGLARRRPPRVLHLGDMAIWPLAVLALFWRGTTIAISAHGTDVAYHRRGGLRGRLYGGYLRVGARLLREARVIANSRATREVAEETGWRDVAVVPLATDLTGHEPEGTHDGSILFAGRLVKRKGCSWFIREVLPLLPGHVRLKVAGTGWDAAERAALTDPRVDFLGPLPPSSLARAYASALCVIVPNIETSTREFEGFGLVAPEAAACGGVVMAADHGGLRDAVIDGETGFLSQSGDALAWADRISEVIAWTPEQRSAFLHKSQAAARCRYSWDRVAGETLAVYRAGSRRTTVDACLAAMR